jgi:1-phosphofructokinase family hexose kinase
MVYHALEMILCITPNPAVDRTIIMPGLVLGHVHRAQKIMVAAGGKGLNVARTIRTLGGEPLCMGFVGGHTGHLLADLTQNGHLESDWTWTNTETRTCTILVSQNEDATVINEPGLPVSSSDWKRLEQDLRKRIPSAGLVCLSGSLPPDSNAEDFRGLLDLMIESGKQVWVDTSGDALKTVLGCPGIHVKVNGNEIGDVLGFEVKDIDSARGALMVLADRMQTTCVITLGSAGAMMISQAGRWQVQGPDVRVVSTVGSGDAFLGGLAKALDDGNDWPGALYDAVAAGTANALSIGGGQFSLEEFMEIRKKVEIWPW